MTVLPTSVSFTIPIIRSSKPYPLTWSHFLSQQIINYPSLIIRYVTEHVFDQDNDIDILAHLSYYDNNDDEYAQVLVFNENGSTLFESDIENTNTWLINSAVANSSIKASLTNTEAGAKMILDVYYFNEELYSYDVYDLPGSLPSSSKDLKALEETSEQLFTGLSCSGTANLWIWSINCPETRKPEKSRSWMEKVKQFRKYGLRTTGGWSGCLYHNTRMVCIYIN